MTLATVTATHPCPCGSGDPYGRCCARYHSGPEHFRAPSPESLMRSRYTAYVLGLADYLLATWHPSTRPTALDAFDPSLKWLGLEIRACARTDADHGTVAFVARSKRAGRAHRLHETSRFVRENGRWLYVDGDLK
jgi:SEC-C motif-containing protein